MADLCVNLVPLFNALPQDEKMQIEKLVQHKNYQIHQRNDLKT